MPRSYPTSAAATILGNSVAFTKQRAAFRESLRAAARRIALGDRLFFTKVGALQIAWFGVNHPRKPAICGVSQKRKKL
jgi:hypothetical protein